MDIKDLDKYYKRTETENIHILNKLHFIHFGGLIMSEYIYKNPLDEGYKKFKLTKKQHNQLFKHKQIKWSDKYEYYINEDGVILHRFYNWKVIILNTIFFPIIVLLNGIVNAKECCTEMKKLYNQKKYGYFMSDYIYSGTETYEQIKNLIQ